MSKHPTPWKLNHHEVILDANERFVCAPTSDPETRAVLLHSMEMWEAIQVCEDSEARLVIEKIESEIAAWRKP